MLPKTGEGGTIPLTDRVNDLSPRGPMHAVVPMGEGFDSGRKSFKRARIGFDPKRQDPRAFSRGVPEDPVGFIQERPGNGLPEQDEVA